MADTVPAVAVKFAVVAPAATVTDAGIVKAELLSDNVTAVPPVEAAFESVTVHVEEAPDARLEGEHSSDETVGLDEVTVTIPPAPDTEAMVPSGRAPNTLVRGIDTVLPLLGVSVTLTTATTPLAIALLFIPLARQVIDPLIGLQLSDLPTPVKAGPAVMATELTSVAAEERIHCRPAELPPVELFNDKFNEMDPP